MFFSTLKRSTSLIRHPLFDMAILSELRKLVAFGLAILIVAMSLQPVQALSFYDENTSEPSAGPPSISNALGPRDERLSIFDDNDDDLPGDKGQSNRLGQGDPLAVIAEGPAATFPPLHRQGQAKRPALAVGASFSSPLKTGPPSL